MDCAQVQFFYTLSFIHSGKLLNFAEKTVAYLKLSGVVNVIFAGDRRMRTLGRKFRGRDAITDVIAFDPGKPEFAGAERVSEVYVNLAQARRQAKTFGHSTFLELAVLISHGFLHLNGMRDDTKNRRKKMLEKSSYFIQKYLK